MPRTKKDPRKLYKVTKKVIDDKEFLCVRYKDLKPADVRELRAEMNLLIKDFFVSDQEKQLSKEVSVECEKCS